MTNWKPYKEPLRATLTRTILIAVVAAAVVSSFSGGLRRWPFLFVLLLWPSFGGHWVDLFFLNWLRPRIPAARPVQLIARLATWFACGVVLAMGLRATAELLAMRAPIMWLNWIVAGSAFIAIELVAHAALQLRGRPSFYNGLG